MRDVYSTLLTVRKCKKGHSVKLHKSLDYPVTLRVVCSELQLAEVLHRLKNEFKLYCVRNSTEYRMHTSRNGVLTLAKLVRVIK